MYKKNVYLCERTIKPMNYEEINLFEKIHQWVLSEEEKTIHCDDRLNYFYSP